jgi:hypothetical protein
LPVPSTILELFSQRAAIPPHPQGVGFPCRKTYEKIGGKGDMIAASDHDQYYLDCSIATAAKKLNKEDVLYLIRCGLCIFEDSLMMMT